MLDLYSLVFISEIPGLIARATLTVLGVGVAVHLICAANFLEPGTAPAHIGILIASGVGAAVGIVHGAIAGGIDAALIASAAACAVLLALSLALWAQGLHVSEHFKNKVQQ
jgi:hypothetical protein